MRAAPIALGLVLLLAAAGGAWWATHPSAPTESWRTAAVERKDILATVSSTGALEAVTSVEVGTQVTGVISELLVDYNDPVTAGQVVARIDTALLEADLRTARAELAVARAQAEQARLERDRVTALHARGAATAAEREVAETDLAVAAARVQASEVALERATRNLGYATIRSPVDGVVVERDVDLGQTVNAGMSAPRLFLIAGNLAEMQILASVDEADIGRIEAGQRVRFTVQAWPDDSFEGTVRQVRLQSVVAENVVTYTVVVGVDNTDGRLLPGMTATVDFVVEEVPDVLCVQTAALRFRPDDAQIDPEALAAAQARRAAREGGERGEAGGERGEAGGGGASGSGASGGGASGSGASGGEASGGGTSGGTSGGGSSARQARGRVWVVADSGLLSPVRVETGASDGTCTEVRGEGITEGMEVVTGVQREGATERSSALSTTRSGTSTSGPGRGPPGGF